MLAATVKRLGITSALRAAPVYLNVPTTHYLCWYCAKQLGGVFTSVRKNDQTLRVHLPCRSPAGALVEEAA
jgi:hypothetical protein